MHFTTANSSLQKPSLDRPLVDAANPCIWYSPSPALHGQQCTWYPHQAKTPRGVCCAERCVQWGMPLAPLTGLDGKEQRAGGCRTWGDKGDGRPAKVVRPVEGAAPA